MHGYRKGGLANKYVVAKADGTPVDPGAVYFVLRLDVDPHARAAAEAYANSIRTENPKLAEDLDGQLRATAMTFRVNTMAGRLPDNFLAEASGEYVR